MKEISKKECHLYQFRGGGQEIFMFFCNKEGIFRKMSVFIQKKIA